MYLLSRKFSSMVKSILGVSRPLFRLLPICWGLLSSDDGGRGRFWGYLLGSNMLMVGGLFVAGGRLLDFDLRLLVKNYFRGEGAFTSSEHS